MKLWCWILWFRLAWKLRLMNSSSGLHCLSNLYNRSACLYLMIWSGKAIFFHYIFLRRSFFLFFLFFTFFILFFIPLWAKQVRRRKISSSTKPHIYPNKKFACLSVCFFSQNQKCFFPHSIGKKQFWAFV